MSKVSIAREDAAQVGKVVGTGVQRKEDDRLLRGAGQFTGDVQYRDGLEMAVLRCPFPHARVEIRDVSLATEVEGVYGVFVGADIVERTKPMTVLRPVPGAVDLGVYALASDRALFEGHPIASIVATSRAVAEDALDLIDIDYEPLESVSDVIEAMEPGAPVVHPDRLSTNLLATNDDGGEDVVKAFDGADLIVEGRFRIGRVSPLPIETRAVVANWSFGRQELEIHAATQTPHLLRRQLADILGTDESEVSVTAADVGGGFGQKLGAYPEDVLACLHSMDVGRPVKWVEDRVEHFRAATHGREAVHDFRIAADSEGRMLAMTDEYVTDIGAYNSSFGSAQLSSIVFPGPYRVTHGSVRRKVALTNKAPVGAYRGYGQPEVNFAREQLVDRLARRLGMDPLELRLRNMLTPEELPWTNPVGAIYDSGDYRRCLELAAEGVDYENVRAGGRGPLPDGRYRGVGLSTFVERTGYPGRRFLIGRGSRYGAHESVTMRANGSGTVEILTGLSTIGQAIETTLAQVCSAVHGIAFESVKVVPGHTDRSPVNTGSFASRTMIAGGGAVAEAAQILRDKTLRVAANLIEDANPEELEISGDRVKVIGDAEQSVALADVHRAAIEGRSIEDDDAPGLEVTVHFEPEAAAFGYGSAAAVVLVDSETGEFEIERFVMAHDSGTPVNPTIVEGQVMGGLAQGIGAALSEELQYDADTGQLVNGSMLDYFVPTANDLPHVELRHTEVPSSVTPMGVRGVGEAGTIPPGAAIANSVCDALAHLEMTLDRLPITPERVWHAICSSRKED